MESLRDELILVTGASGFIASHTVKQLLQLGARVRGTVRDPDNEGKVGFLKTMVPEAADRLELVKADLLDKDCWTGVVAGCKHVVHVASPLPSTQPRNADELIRPAVEGTLSVLQACANASTVKTVVITSSMVGCYDPKQPIPAECCADKTITEDVWTDGHDVKGNAYTRSKALAEKAAWEFMEQLPEDKRFNLATINPVLVFGPLLSNTCDSTTVALIKRILERRTPAIAKLLFPIIDVRDVALAHIKALITQEAWGKRHLIVDKCLWMKDVAHVIDREFRHQGYNIPLVVVPNVLVWLNSLFNKELKPAVRRLSRKYYISNDRMRQVLKIEPISSEQSIIDTCYRLIELGLVKPSRKANAVANSDPLPANLSNTEVATN